MAENSITYDFDVILSSTLMNYRANGKFKDNITSANPTMWWLHEKKRATQDGGQRIVIPIRFAKNSTVKSYSGYDPFDTTPQDNQTSAYYEWRQLGGTITIDGMTKAKNSGKSRIIKILDEKISNCEDTMAEDINLQLWAITPGAKDILSIPAMIVKAPQTTDAAAPGGLDGTAKTYWRNKYKESSATTVKALVWEMRNLYNSCSLGGNKMKRGYPDLGVCNQYTYESVENHMSDKERYMNADTAAKARSVGFENIKFKQCTLFFDEHVPDAYGDGTTGYDWDNASWTYGSLYFMNTNFIEYVTMPGKDLHVGGFIESATQDAWTSKVVHYHQLCTSARRKQGVLTKINSSTLSE